MFVLCPHCHFLVGVDPRTGKPPTHCPKCGNVVIEAVPVSEPSTETAPAIAIPLDPFAQAELPSLAQSALSLPEPEAAPEPLPQPETPPAPAKPARKPRSWFKRKEEPVAEPAPTPIAETPPQTPPPSSPEPNTDRADAMIEAMIGRKAAPRKKSPPRPTPSPPPIEPMPAIERVEVEVDALPPAVQLEDVIAAPVEPVIEATVEEVIEAAAEIAKVETVDEASAEVAADTAVADAMHEPVTETATQVATIDATARTEERVERRAQPQPRVIADDDDDPDAPDAFTAAVAEILPPTPMRRRSDGVAPSFHRRERAPISTRAHLRAIAAVSALVLLLTLQLLLAQRNELAANPRWRPLVGTLCGVLHCTLPPWREPTAFTMLSRDVRPHPGAPGTLLINASFRNDARWPQPWPSLQLTLSDLDGRMVGARAFAAREYLGAAPTQKELAPGQSAAITLAVVEPAPNVVAFTFDFR